MYAKIMLLYQLLLKEQTEFMYGTLMEDDIMISWRDTAQRIRDIAIQRLLQQQ